MGVPLPLIRPSIFMILSSVEASEWCRICLPIFPCFHSALLNYSPQVYSEYFFFSLIQVEHYARRKEMSVSEVERWLGPILGYETDQ